jgi:hypothetical protein
VQIKEKKEKKTKPKDESGDDAQMKEEAKKLKEQV